MGKGGAGEKTRGELGEIRTSLAALSGGGVGKADAVAAKRDLFKRIINFMTIGVDMSSLFMQVMTCAVSNNDDLVLKKMLYLYICTYAQANPDLTLLTINLLQKDCKDQDPTIRGLALRSLCQLKVVNLVEYLVRSFSALCGGCFLFLRAQGCSIRHALASLPLGEHAVVLVTLWLTNWGF